MFKPFPSFSPQYKFILLTVILIIVFAAYLPTLTSDFVQWDDDVHLYENITIRSLDYEHVEDIFKSTVNKTYIPLTILSFAIEYHYFGYNPFVYHLDNLLLHLAVVTFIFFLGLRLGLSEAGSGVAALLFGIHPMHVESVAWVTERKDVLYAFFYMAALLSYSLYLDFTKSTPAMQSKKPYRFLVLTIMLGILSMLAKPMALSLPLILLLLDWFHGRKMTRSVILEKLPLSIAIAGITWVTYAAHARIPGKSIVEGLLIWPWTFVFYLRQFIFPVISVPVYQLPKPIAVSNLDYLLPLVVLGLLVFALIRFRKYRWFMFSVAFYFFSIFFLLRYDEMKDANIVADRFMYLPSLGFCVLAGVGWIRIWGRRWMRVMGTVGLMVLTVVFSVKTYQQCQIWRDSITLWEYQLKVFPDEPIALNNLAAALREQEKYKDAEETYRKLTEMQPEGMPIEFSDEVTRDIQKVDYLRSLYERAIKAEPKFIESYCNLGNLLSDIGKISEAFAAYKKALNVDYEYKDAHFGLGDLYRQAGDDTQAIYAYKQAMRFYPDDEDVYVNIVQAYTETLKENPENDALEQARQEILINYTKLINGKPSRARSFFNLGSLFQEMGDLERALSAYQMALDINPNDRKTLYNLGNLLKDQGRLNEALTIYKKAIKVDPRNSNIYLNMGIIYGRQGNNEEAKVYYQKAVKADPSNAKAYFNLAYIYEVSGDLRDSVVYYQKSIGHDSKNVEAYYNLGNAYARLHMSQKAISSYLKAVEIDPDYLNAWVNLSTLSFRFGDYTNAVRYCDEAILLGYNAPEGYLNALKPYRE